MPQSIKTFLSDPKVQAELHSAAVTFLTVFFAVLSTGVGSGNLSKEALISVSVMAVRSAVKAVYQTIVTPYAQK